MLYLGRDIQPQKKYMPQIKTELPPVPKAKAPVFTLDVPGYKPKSAKAPALPLSSERDPNAPVMPWGNFPGKIDAQVPPIPNVIPPRPVHSIEFGGREDSSSFEEAASRGLTVEEPTSKETKDYRSSLPCRLPEDISRRVIGLVAGADGIMSVGQQRSMLRYAIDRDTLRKENESLGLIRANQIWKVLEATGCLSYEMVI